MYEGVNLMPSVKKVTWAIRTRDQCYNWEESDVVQHVKEKHKSEKELTSPWNKADNKTEKKGSMGLMVWVKET